MKVFEIEGYWLDDNAPFTHQKVAEFDNTPTGYSDDDIFYYGITPEVGRQYDDFMVTKVELYDEVAV